MRENPLQVLIIFLSPCHAKTIYHQFTIEKFKALKHSSRPWTIGRKWWFLMCLIKSLNFLCQCLEAKMWSCMIHFLFKEVHFLKLWSLNLVNHFRNLSIIDISSYSLLLWHVIVCYAYNLDMVFFFYIITNSCINDIVVSYERIWLNILSSRPHCKTYKTSEFFINLL